MFDKRERLALELSERMTYTRRQVTDAFFARLRVEFSEEELVELADLEAAREALVTTMVGEMPDAHREFLIGFKRGEPDWELLGIPEAKHLPAVVWKQRNLEELRPEKRQELIEELKNLLLF